MCDKWIWLPRHKYPNNQTTIYSILADNGGGNFTVAEFKRSYSFKKEVRSLKLRFSGDTDFRLYINGELLATGPASVGGDFLGNDKQRPNFYATEMEVFPHCQILDFFAEVKMMPVKMCEYSKGHGGFMLSALIKFDDGTESTLTTDSSWETRQNTAYVAPFCYDGNIAPDDFVFAEETEDIWHAQTAPIPPRSEKEIYPINGATVHFEPNEECELSLEFDMIHAGFAHIVAKTKGTLSVELICRETEDSKRPKKEKAVFRDDGEYRGFSLQSVGSFYLKAKNDSDFPAELSLGLITTHYPITKVSLTKTSDPDLDRVLDVCRHTLKYCRQTLHLDSPRHCEPLACTGDYYIESLMTQFSFGDMRLAEFDVVRTAELLRNNDGRMFHTAYSLIWVLMLHDVYMATGNKALLSSCRDALGLLLSRFKGYLGDNGIIENPPDYMFVDWIYIDELSLHHPPKALGQTCLNMFYFGALDKASRIYRELGDECYAKECEAQREALRKAINSILYDAERGLYFEGLNTKTPEHLLAEFMPQNVGKKYYLKHSNILAAYFGVCDDELARALVDKIMINECEGDYQPYFAHYLLEAIFRLGLRDKYTLALLERWKAPINECPKGLVEGFVVPEPTYHFDHSHAWGGTPLYSLPRALLGFEILESGMKKIKLAPSLLGLEYAHVELQTPFGDITVDLHENQPPKISVPNEITLA